MPAGAHLDQIILVSGTLCKEACRLALQGCDAGAHKSWCRHADMAPQIQTSRTQNLIATITMQCTFWLSSQHPARGHWAAQSQCSVLLTALTRHDYGAPRQQHHADMNLLQTCGEEVLGWALRMQGIQEGPPQAVQDPLKDPVLPVYLLRPVGGRTDLHAA